ncbi:MAG: vWA domain-containing protein [Alphaproteobacteria bacterium]
MDEKKLEEILSKDNAPEIDVNARKRALNLAMSEFETQKQKKNQKSSQGISLLARLIGISNSKRGNETMEQKTKTKFIYGGMATAMAVVLVGGLSFTQLEDTLRRFDNQMPKGSEITSVPGVNEEVSPAYIQAVEERNEESLERAIASSSSSIPTPIQSPQPVAKKEIQADPLSDWSRNNVNGVKDANKAQAKSKAGKRVELAEQEASPMEQWAREPSKPSIAQPVVNSSLLGGAVESFTGADVVSNAQEAKKSFGASNVMQELVIMDDVDIVSPNYQDEGRDKFEDFDVNAFKSVSAEPVSTFSSDVDTASYSFIRRQLNNGMLPQKDAVRVEEMVNYFDYNYPVPQSRAEPFKPTVTVTDSPWAEGKKLMHIGIKGYQLEKTALRSNVVFLLDVSGSMNASDKLPLVKNSMKMLLDSLHPDDTVSIVTYAGSTGVVLEPTKASQHRKIINAMDNLHAGGGTAGAAGIKLAYDMAEENFDKRAVNRVILATDGDFNVGITNREELQDFVERKRDKGIFLSVLGFGQGNYNDHMMQTLAQNGNGTAAYIDNLNEARKVLVEEATSSLFPIAKDVKFQIEFNPTSVAEYRLIGYETRHLNREDFNNDKIDAGDMGAGHSVSAIYEFIPVGSDAVSVDALRYTSGVKKKNVVPSDEYAYLKIRYKLPMESKSKLISAPVMKNFEYKKDMTDTNFATSVAAFGQILKGGQYTGEFSYDDVISLAQQGKGDDKFGYRAEFINMVRLAKTHSR